MSNAAHILVATDVVGDADLVRKLLRDEFDNVVGSTDPKRAIEDVEKHRPEVFILAFDTLEKSERYYLGLYRQSSVVHALPHRTLILCGKDEVQRAYGLCLSGHFDDYILFWPMTHDSTRLPMSVHLALQHLAAQRDSGPRTADFAAQAMRLAEMETLLESQMAQGGQRIEMTGRMVAQAEEKIGAAFDGLSHRLARGELSDLVDVKNANALGREFARVQAEEIRPPLRSVAKSLEPLAQWTKDMKSEMQPHVDSARSLAALAERVLPVLMVVDDDEFQRALVGAILGAANYQVALAASGVEALSALHKVRPNLILMDLMMPDMDGLQTLQQIKSAPQYARVPIIMVTGKSDGNIVRDSLKAGATDFIVKPVERSALLAKISRALRQLPKPAAPG